MARDVARAAGDVMHWFNDRRLGRVDRFFSAQYMPASRVGLNSLTRNSCVACPEPLTPFDSYCLDTHLSARCGEQAADCALTLQNCEHDAAAS